MGLVVAALSCLIATSASADVYSIIYSGIVGPSNSRDGLSVLSGTYANYTGLSYSEKFTYDTALGIYGNGNGSTEFDGHSGVSGGPLYSIYTSPVLSVTLAVSGVAPITYSANSNGNINGGNTPSGQSGLSASANETINPTTFLYTTEQIDSSIGGVDGVPSQITIPVDYHAKPGDYGYGSISVVVAYGGPVITGLFFVPDEFRIVAGDAPNFAGAVPEPSTWALMMLGFAGIGAMAYRRRNSALRLI